MTRTLCSEKVTVDWEVILKALCVLADYDGTKDTRIGQRINVLSRSIQELVTAAEDDEESAEFWWTHFKVWKEWIGLPEQLRPDPADVCADFDDPERAAAFLTCPPLSPNRCARLFAGLDTPANAYEAHVAKIHPSLQGEVMREEPNGPKRRIMYRLRALKGSTRSEAEKYIRQMDSHGLTLLRGNIEVDIGCLTPTIRTCAKALQRGRETRPCKD